MVSDIGGASAEMYGSDCQRRSLRARFLPAAPGLRAIPAPGNPTATCCAGRGALPGVKKVMLGSGVRHDLLLRNPDLLEEIMREHCGRFLRVAPEHTEDEVLDLMGKPRFAVFEEFVAPVRAAEPRTAPARRAGPLPDRRPSRAKPPPWCRCMKEKLRALGLKTCDAQIFTPTPGTLSTAMYHSGLSAGRQAPGRREGHPRPAAAAQAAPDRDE